MSTFEAKRPRGRPRKVLPPAPSRKPRLPLALKVTDWCARTGESRSTVMGRIKRGELRTVKGPNTSPHRIPVTELVRLSYAPSLHELITLIESEAAFAVDGSPPKPLRTAQANEPDTTCTSDNATKKPGQSCGLSRAETCPPESNPEDNIDA